MGFWTFERLDNAVKLRINWRFSPPVDKQLATSTEFLFTQSQIAGLCQKFVAFHSGQVSCYETGYDAGTRPANRG